MTVDRNPEHAATLAHPAAAVKAVEQLPGVHVTRTLDWRRGVEFEATFEPMLVQRREGYRDEQVRVLVRRVGQPLSYPRGARRRWKHRNPPAHRINPDEAWMAHSLCLWYPRDPRPLRWEWEDGLPAYFDRLHKHLLMEEHWRRTDRWPSEDAEHGHPAEGQGEGEGNWWPVASAEMKEVIRRWDNSLTGQAIFPGQPS